MLVFTETILTIIVGTISHRVGNQLITVGTSPSWETFLGTILITGVVGRAIVSCHTGNTCSWLRGCGIGILAAITIVTW